MKPYLFHHHTREQLKQLASEGYAVVIPLAATEQHGPHLTVYTDSLICEHVVYSAVETASVSEGCKLLATPMLSIGCSEHHLAFGGTLSFSPETYLRMLKEIGRSLIADGFRKLIFLNAHGGNASVMAQAANDLAVEYPVWTACASYWSIAGPALAACQANEVGKVPGHAGGFETSLILALAPELVDLTRVEASHPERAWVASRTPGTFIGRHRELTGVDGFTDAPIRADGVHGRLYLDIINCEVAKWLVQTCRTMEEEEGLNDG